MNFNITAYILYLVIILYVTIYVGYKFHKNGEVYILQLTEDKTTGIAINNLLLVLYYCLNIGYAILLISKWQKVDNWMEMLNSVGYNSGIFILLLGGLHYINMLWIYLIFNSKKLKHFKL